MKTRWLPFIVVVAVAAAAILAGCGPKVIPPEKLAELDGEDPKSAIVMMRYRRVIRDSLYALESREDPLMSAQSASE